jgi:hypothetical protein
LELVDLDFVEPCQEGINLNCKGLHSHSSKAGKKKLRTEIGWWSGSTGITDFVKSTN